MIDSRFFWVEEKSNPRGSLFRFPAMDPGAARDTERSAFPVVGVYRRTRSCYALQIFVLPSRLYINDRFPSFQSWFMDRAFAFPRVLLVIHLFPPDVFEISPPPPPSPKVGHRKPENLFPTNFAFLIRRTTKCFERAATKQRYFECYDDQIREIKFLSMLGHLR